VEHLATSLSKIGPVVIINKVKKAPAPVAALLETPPKGVPKLVVPLITGGETKLLS
jgi:hypothetical protein